MALEDMGQADAFLAGGGEMGALMRSHDWSATPIGAPSGWPQPLRTAVRLLLNTGHPMYIWWGPELLCFYNDAYRRSIGSERHPGSIGRPAREVWDEIWDIIGPQIDQVMAGRGATWHEDHLVPITRDGHLDDVYWTYSYSPIDNETAPNGVGGVLVVCTETTGKVETEQRLAAQVERQQRVFQKAPGFICILGGPEHRFEFANEAYGRLVGNRALVGRTVREAFPEIADQGFYEVLDQVFETGTRYVAEHVPVMLQHKSGAPPEERILDFIYEPMIDEKGAVEGIFCEGYDVTDRRRAEDALRASEARYHTLFETMDEGFCVIEFLDGPHGPLSDYVHVEANPAYVRHAGIPDVVGQKVREMVPDEAAGWIELYRNVLATGEPIRFERVLEATRRHLELAPFRIGPAEPRQVAVLFQDVTGRKRAENELRDSEARLRELNETLEQWVEARTAELIQAQEQLRQSQKLEAMGQLTGGVAHDFNNLLTPIMGVLDVLKRRGVGGERKQRLIDGGLQSAERAKTLVHRLLAFARRQPLQPGPVDLAMLVEGMAELIASTSGPQIKLVIDIPDGLPAAEADRNQLEMAVLNLSVNARDAMPNGGRLTISAASETVGPGHRSQLRTGEYLRLSVADTGEGMDEATLKRAIEPFFSTKGIGKGTGLGLSMVHGLAAQLGGAFAISSKPGLGTCVDLWLPRSDQAADASGSESADSATRRGRGTALLVDDEDLVRASTADMLSELGFEVIEAGSAAEALAKLDGGLDVDILITDHMMPGMNGVDLAREVRDRMPGKPVLIVSGYAETDSIAPDLPRLIKPFRQADLVARLSNLAAEDVGAA